MLPVRPALEPRGAGTPAVSALAYLFWHWPGPGVGGGAYEAELLGFHAALGRVGSVSLRVLDPAPFPGAAAPLYLDWYPAAGWADLGVLNVDAVSGAPRASHHAAAAMTGGGHGEVRARVSGRAAAADARVAHWCARPAGTQSAAYLETLVAELGDGAAVWRRQMVLGPAPELCVLADRPLDLPGQVTVTRLDPWRAADDHAAERVPSG